MSNKATIAALNDELRTTLVRGGKTLLTNGVASLGAAHINRITQAVRAFSDFTGDNDPHNEHDFGAVDVDGDRFFWKIDYYDNRFEGGSENPADPTCTQRVMTIMFAHEY